MGGRGLLCKAPWSAAKRRRLLEFFEACKLLFLVAVGRIISLPCLCIRFVETDPRNAVMMLPNSSILPQRKRRSKLSLLLCQIRCRQFITEIVSCKSGMDSLVCMYLFGSSRASATEAVGRGGTLSRAYLKYLGITHYDHVPSKTRYLHYTHVIDACTIFYIHLVRLHAI